MHEPTEAVTRRTYLKTIGAVGAASAIGLAGCAGSASATGTLATRVTDQPGDIADFESCVVTIAGVWLKPAGAETEDATESTPDGEDDTADGEPTETIADETATAEVDESSARDYYAFDEPQEADLVQLQDGNTDLVDERNVTAQEYEYLQLDVAGVEGTLADGGAATVDTPGNAPLQFKQNFEVREGQRTTFVADFTPVKRGRTDQYLLRPVATNTDVIYGERETATTES